MGDIDGNGTADLVGLGDGYIGVYRTNYPIGDPDTGSYPASSIGYQTWSTTTFYGTHGTFLGDVNGDGKADLVALNDGNVTVMLSSGNGFRSPQDWWSTAFYGDAGALLGDVDGDGEADLVQVGSTLGVRRSTGSGFVGYDYWS